jgi:hydroxymethylglutaryl-CoA lyase
MSPALKLVECPRDAMQGIVEMIPTADKVAYLQQLLAVGFDTLDFGSFVSPKAIPQLADTAEVLSRLDLSRSRTRLLAIVANLRGAQEAAQHAAISYLGYPFSISETFQLRNTNKTIAASLELVGEMQALCQSQDLELVVYISMGFGNPYGDPWSPGLAADWVGRIADLGVRTISLADTVGTADPTSITPLFQTLIPQFPKVELGAHFHARPEERRVKLQAAYDGGCRRFDSALLGFGGCPFAEDELVGNIATETLLEWMHEGGLAHGLDLAALQAATVTAGGIFGRYH